MARGRMLSNTIQNSKKILSVMDAEPKMHEFIWLLYSWIMPQTDDFGHFDADPRVVKAKVLPCSERKIKDFEVALDAMEKVGLIIIYGEGPFLEIVGFSDHQTLRKDRPHIPMFPERTELNTRKCDGLPVTPSGLPVTPVSEGKLSKVKRSKENKDIYLEEVYLKKEEYEKLKVNFPQSLEAKILNLNGYIASQGLQNKYVDHYQTILNFARRDGWDGKPETDRDLSQY